MRFLIRVAVLALAAFGAKALYDRFAPRREELGRTASDLLSRTASAGREVKDKAAEVTGRVVSVAQEGAASIADTAAEQANEVKSAAEDARAAASDASTTTTSSTSRAG